MKVYNVIVYSIPLILSQLSDIKLSDDYYKKANYYVIIIIYRAAMIHHPL